MQIGRKYHVSFMPDEVARVLDTWIDAANKVVENKVNQYELDLWHYKHCMQRTSRYQHKDKPRFRTLKEPKLDYSYSKYWVKDKTKYMPPEILRNAITFRFYTPYELHEKDPETFGKPSRDRDAKSVLLTKELFEFNADCTRLTIKTRKGYVGTVSINQHQSCDKPKMVHMTHENENWYVSFSYDDNKLPPTALDYLQQCVHKYTKDDEVVSVKEILSTVNGYDYGIKIGCIDKEGMTYGWDEKLWNRQLNDQRRVDGLKSAQSKKIAGSHRYEKTDNRIITVNERMINRRKHVNHQGSHDVSKTNYFIQAIEDTKLGNLLKKCEPKFNGYEYLPNGQKAKTSTLKALKSRSIGDLQVKTEYKTVRERKLAVWVPAHGTSCTCIKCGDRHKENRLTQSQFKCRKCGESENADKHAAQYIAHITAHNIQFLVYALIWMQHRKVSLSAGTAVFLLTGKKKTACISLSLGGLLGRVRSCIIGKDPKLWNLFQRDLTAQLPGNLLTMHDAPTKLV